MEQLVHWLEDHMMPCFYKQLTGVDCPGCGMQRSFIELLRGDLAASLSLYPALLPVLFTLLFTAAHLIFRFRNGAAIVKYSFIISTGIAVTSFIIRLLL